MFKAFDYTDKRIDDRIRDEKILSKEKEIALQFVLNNPLKRKECDCPICDSKETSYFFQLWDVDYLICNECKSIFVPVETSTMDKYRNLKSLKDFRENDNYQQLIKEIRGNIYEEEVSWIKYRTYRYLHKKDGLKIIDLGNKYKNLTQQIEQADWVDEYEQIYFDSDYDAIATDNKADVLISMNQLQHEEKPIEMLVSIKRFLKDDGILILNTRLGSGFDILTLKGETDDIYPYEHIMLPSLNGLKIALDKAGYELLEITTPGTRDMNIVMDKIERLKDDNFFIKYLLETADEQILRDFQQFLQKSCLSSFVRVIARKK